MFNPEDHKPTIDKADILRLAKKQFSKKPVDVHLAINGRFTVFFFEAPKETGKIEEETIVWDE